MAPRRFVDGSTEELGRGWEGGLYLSVAWDSLSFVAFAFSHTLRKGGRPVGRYLSVAQLSSPPAS